MTIKRWIDITFMKPGLHRYPQAQNDPKLADVAYLGSEHFHYFFYYVTVEVFHDDRDLEFHQFRRWCESLYESGTLKMDHQSCEMLAESLIESIQAKHPGRDIKVGVYEDDINGAIVEMYK